MQKFFFLSAYCLSLLLVGSSAQAQNPAVISASLSPMRNAPAVNPATTVVVPFSQTVNPATAGTIKIFGNQYRGQRTATASTGGGTVTLTPTAPAGRSAAFRPGETVSVTVPGALQSTGGVGATPYVYQFTAATSGGSGNFVRAANAYVGNGTAGTGTNGQALGDIDGDGDLDMVAANYRGTVSVQFNNGNGSFSGTTEVTVGSQAWSVVLGDLDGDGDLDFAAVNRGANPSTVSVRLNNGSGQFSGTTNVAVGTGAYSIALGDLDGDGDLDFVTANSGSSNVSVQLNDGSGTFSAAASVPLSSQPGRSIALGDLDGDGDLDFAVTNASQVTLGLNAGNGTFSVAPPVSVPYPATAVAVADGDGDGDLDLFISNYYQPSMPVIMGVVSVRLNNGSGSFTTGPDLPVPLGGPIAGLTMGDVNGDGQLDIIGSNNYEQVFVWRNTGGTFTQTSRMSVTMYASTVATGDVDGDGDLDIIAGGSYDGNVSVNLNTAATPTASPLTMAQVALYPNPAVASSSVRVALPLTTGTSEVQATIFSLLGQVIATAVLPVHTGQAVGLLPTAGLGAGLYTVRLQIGGATVSKRLIIY